MKLLQKITLTGLLCSSAAFASTYNGYYHKDTANPLHYDAVARYATSGITIDGKITQGGEWDTTLSRHIYKYDRDDNRIRYTFQYDNNNLYILVEVDDDKLWDNHASANTWETNDDDGVEIYLDPNNSRDVLLQDADRVIAFTIQSRHYRYDKGDGVGNTAYYGEISSIQKAVSINGTLNDNSDVDQGYTVELAIPWQHLGGVRSALSLISANIMVVEDDDGQGPLRANHPLEVNRFYEWFGDGLKGPANYARIMLLPQNDSTPPAAVSNLHVIRTQPMSAVISFTATGDDNNTGMAKAYAITYTLGGKTVDYPNSFVPKIAGKTEQLRILGLRPNKSYQVNVSAIDHAGNYSNPVSVTVNTSNAPSNYGKGHIYPSPVGRYFVYENGEAFLPVTQASGISWVGFKDLYTRELWEPGQHTLINWSTANVPEDEKASTFVKFLADKGINFIRIFIEDLAFADAVQHNGVPFPDGISWLEFPATTDGSKYINETLKFMDDLMQLCQENGIFVTLTPWDNYFYRADIFHAHPYNVANGGQISTREEFITNSEARQAQKQRLSTLHSRLKNYPNFFGWEMMNEFDNDTFASRPTNTNRDMGDRITWVKDLQSHLKAIDPEFMMTISSVIEEPRFELKDFVLQNDLFDFVGIHNYTAAVSDPTATGDSDMSIRPAVEAARRVRYQIGNTMDFRPVFDLEFGPIDVESYGYYSQEIDEKTFHNLIWSGFAAGGAGMPLRWPSKVLEPNGVRLTENMWASQANMARFFASTHIDFTNFSAMPWERDITLGGNGQNLKTFATSDGQQGLVYVLQDTRVASASVSGANITVGGLQQNGAYAVELWDTHDSNATIQLQTVQANNQRMRIDLPTFNNDYMLTFRYLTYPYLSNAISFDANGNNANHYAAFSGGLAFGSNGFQAKTAVSLQDTVKVAGEITVNAAHIGQTADVFIFAEYVAPNDSQYFMLNEMGSVLGWAKDDFAGLTAFEQVTLQPVQKITMYQGQFVGAGQLKIHFGYRLPDGTVVYNSEPIDITISE